MKGMKSPTTYLDLRHLADYRPEAVILAQGDYPAAQALIHHIERVPHLVVCDGAIRTHLERSQRKPDCVIGDGDSVPLQLLRSHNIPFIHIRDQETNDLTKSVTHCLRQGWHDIAILAGTGKREDHTIGNIFLLPEYSKMGARVRMLSDHGIFIPLSGYTELTVEVGTQLSFFPTDSHPMTAEGVRYPFDARRFDALWQATLNEAVASQVTLHTEGVMLLYVAHERKSPPTL